VISLSEHARAYFSELSGVARAGLIHKGSFVSDNLASGEQQSTCAGHLIFGPIEQHCEWVSNDPLLPFDMPKTTRDLSFLGYQHVGQKLVIGKDPEETNVAPNMKNGMAAHRLISYISHTHLLSGAGIHGEVVDQVLLLGAHSEQRPLGDYGYIGSVAPMPGTFIF